MAILLMDEIELQIRKVQGVMGVSFDISSDRITADLIVTPANLVSQVEDEVRQIFQHYYEGIVNLKSVGIPPLPKETPDRPIPIFADLFPGSIRLISPTKKPLNSNAYSKPEMLLEANGITVKLNRSISVGSSILESVRELISVNFIENTPLINNSTIDTDTSDTKGSAELSESNLITLANGIAVDITKVKELINFVKDCRIQEAIVEPEVSYSAKVIVASQSGNALGVSKSYVKEDAEALATLHALLRILSDVC